MYRKTASLLFSVFFILLFEMLPAFADSMTETIKANYLAFKQSIASDPEKDRGPFFDVDIETAKREMGIGFNFGNSLDWAFDNSKLRRYKIKISLGYDDEEYFYYESYASMTGNLYNAKNHPRADLPYAELPLTRNGSFHPDPSTPINCLKVMVSNDYPEAAGTDVTVNLKYLRLINNNGENVIVDHSLWKEYPAVVQPNDATAVVIPLGTTVGSFDGADARILADIQLDHFISDYKNRPELVYVHSYNVEPATEEELAFLKEQGFSTIRLPVTWYAHMDSGGTVDPEWFDEVKRIVDRILNYDFYVILNIHHDAGKKGWIKADAVDFQQHEYLYRYLVLQIAENFKHYGSKLILAGPNEITNYRKLSVIYPNTSGTDIFTSNLINQLFVDEVRSTGYGNTNRFLMVGPWYALPKNLEYYQLPLDKAENKIFTEFHDYLTEDETVLRSLEFFAESDMDWLSSFNLVMSEFGIPRDKEMSVKLAFMEKHVSEIYQFGIPMIVWDDGGDYALMDNQKAAWDTAWESDQVAEAMLEAYRKNSGQ